MCLAMQVETRSIVAMSVGSRSKRNLSIVVRTVLNSEPTRVMTDGLEIYKSLIPAVLHIVKGHCCNHIERLPLCGFNLSLRTSLKRLSRRTICYSRSRLMLLYCVRLACSFLLYPNRFRDSGRVKCW
ncbi:MAG: IS1 family transposase [Flavobacteriales bacterium]